MKPVSENVHGLGDAVIYGVRWQRRVIFAYQWLWGNCPFNISSCTRSLQAVLQINKQDYFMDCTIGFTRFLLQCDEVVWFVRCKFAIKELSHLAFLSFKSWCVSILWSKIMIEDCYHIGHLHWPYTVVLNTIYSYSNCVCANSVEKLDHF